MAGTFKALGDLTRLQIIYLLATDTSGTLGVGDLAIRLGISQPGSLPALKDAERLRGLSNHGGKGSTSITRSTVTGWSSSANSSNSCTQASWKTATVN